MVCAVAAAALGLGFGARGASADPNWWKVAVCETGGRWDWGQKHRPAEGDLYEGGVGFAASTWQLWAGSLRLLARYPHAYDAPAAVQIRVAEYGWRRGGYWGCLQ